MRKILKLGLISGVCFNVSVMAATKSPSQWNPITYTDSGITFQSPEGRFTLTPSLYANLDGALFNNSSKMPAGVNSGVNLRHVRASFSGRLYNDFGYKAEYDLVSEQFTSLFVSYNGLARTTFRLGQFQPAFTLEDYSYVPAITLMETSLPVFAFSPGFRPGAMGRTSYKDFTFSANVFLPRYGTAVTGDDPLGTTERVTYSPVHRKTRVWHFGVAHYYQDVSNVDGTSFSTIPELQARNTTRALNTGTIANSRYYNSVGVEAAHVRGPFFAQVEGIETWVNRKASSDVNFYGAYATVGYFLTGESRLYDFASGSFDGITPIQNRKLGAWQLAGRLSYLDLNDKDIIGGKETNATLGVRWFANKRLNFQANYVYANYHPTSSDQSAHSNGLGLRMEVLL